MSEGRTTISELAVGPGSTLLAASWSSSVEVWSLVDRRPRLVGAFETVHDDGVRVALAGGPDDDALRVVAAAYDRHGVVGYAARSGERLWQRRDLKQCDDVRYAGGDLVVVNLDGRRKHVLDSRTGETVQALSGMAAMVCHDPDTGRVAWWDSRFRLRVGDPREAPPAVVPLPPWPRLPPFPTWEMLRGDTLVLNASTSGTGLPSGELVWCLDLRAGAERWRTTVPGSGVRVHGIRRDGCVLGQADGEDGASLWVADGTGGLTWRPWDRSLVVAHLREADVVVTSDRRVLDDTTFDHVATLAWG